MKEKTLTFDCDVLARNDGFRSSLPVRLSLWLKGLRGKVVAISATCEDADGSRWKAEGWFQPDGGVEYVTRVVRARSRR